MENDTIDETLLELRKSTLACLLQTPAEYIYETFLSDDTFDEFILFATHGWIYWMLLSDQIHMLEQDKHLEYIGEHEKFHIFKRRII